MRLSDSAMRERMCRDDDTQIGIIPPPNPWEIQPASIDLHLGDSFIIYVSSDEVLSLKSKPRAMRKITSREVTLHPGEFILGSTLERIEVPSDLVAIVEGKSSLGRLGLAVHITAGFIDPGFRGNITLELKNMNHVHAIMLHQGMDICQICFEEISGEVLRPYGSRGLNSKYQDSEGTIGSRATSHQK